MRRWQSTLALVGLSALMALSGCANQPGDSPAQPDPNEPADPIDPKEVVGPSDPVFMEAFEKSLDEGKKLTPEKFVDKYRPADAAVPSNLTYDPTASTYFDLIDEALDLTQPEVDRLKQEGFMVSERLRFPTFGEALQEVYARDLPVLVTTDMILQALHSSYDDILKTLEQTVLSSTLEDVLARSHAALADVPTGGSDVAAAAGRDADFYLAVARSLLTGTQVPTNAGGELDDLVADFLGFVQAEQMRTISIFGTNRKMDFSQFTPRGHYEGVPELERYFQAMMWLGRVDMRFTEYDALTDQWVFRKRQLVAASLLHRAVESADAMTDWHHMNDIITLMVGPVDYIDLRGMGDMVETYDFASPADVAAIDDKTQAELQSDLMAGTFGEQKINSHWLETNPMTSEPTPLPASFALLGQRFVVDSYVFANVVYDNIVYDGKKVERVLPDPLDALFVLGNDQVVDLLKPELEKFPYQANLHQLRFLVDQYDADFWDSNLYNMWLQALRTLNPPTTSDAYPEPMRHTAWRDRIVNTQLGSWAQLRHDTLLYAKQSYTGGVSCEHPDGFVEPYPAFFAQLRTMADKAKALLASVPFDNSWTGEQIANHFTTWSDTMGKLEAMAKKSLEGVAYTEDEILFLKGVIQSNQGCGAPFFSGWYTDLFFGGSDSVSDFKPTVADVHTNPNAGPLPGPDVLHVATGQANLMVLTAETCKGPEAYVGPVFSYYEIDVPEIRRMTDSEWKEDIQTGDMPARPEWTASFLVSE